LARFSYRVLPEPNDLVEDLGHHAGRHAGAGDPGDGHGSRRTIGVAARAVAALALLHPISILVRPVPGDLLQPAREDPWRSA
jgi:hypothetical protein